VYLGYFTTDSNLSVDKYGRHISEGHSYSVRRLEYDDRSGLGSERRKPSFSGF
jgi:hypothetical protein